MENVGHEPSRIYGTVHTPAYNHTLKTAKGGTLDAESPAEKFHVYALEWSKDRLDFFVDDRRYFTFHNEGRGNAVWPFDKPQYLILNLAIGGDWGGERGINDQLFPHRYLIDFVRVYHRPDAVSQR
jgi:beta-glucanase (GH16 family)